MRVDVDDIQIAAEEPRVGFVYAVRGGRGAKYGHMMVVIAITEPSERYEGPSVLMLIVDKTGAPRGVTSYAIHYIRAMVPVAFCEGLDDMVLRIRSLL